MPKSIHRVEYAVVVRKLRQARLDSGLNQTDIAAALKRSQSFVSDVENGTRRLDLIELRDVCKVLGLDFLDFVHALEQDLRALPTVRRAPRRKPSATSRK